MLWKKIKYDWLSWEAYTSHKNLCEELDKVLSQIGSTYYITFVLRCLDYVRTRGALPLTAVEVRECWREMIFGSAIY